MMPRAMAAPAVELKARKKLQNNVCLQTIVQAAS